MRAREFVNDLSSTGAAKPNTFELVPVQPRSSSLPPRSLDEMQSSRTGNRSLWAENVGQPGVTENFADGRNPQNKGDSKRYKVPTKGKISTLRKIAKQGGRRGQLAHWMANMRSGRKK